MPDAFRDLTARYGTAVFFTALAVALRWLVHPWLGYHTPLTFLYAAVAASVWFLGYRAAILSAVLGYFACDYLFIDPYYRFHLSTSTEIIRLAAYILSCGVLIGLGEAARQARQRTNRILESITDAHYTLDHQWRFRLMNSRAQEYFGKTETQLVGKCVWDVFPAARGSQIEHNYRQAVTSQTPVHFEAFSPVVQRWVEVHAYPTSFGLSVFFKDIHARKMAEAELRQRETQLRLITDNAPGLLSYIDRDLRYQVVNQRYEEWFGRPRNQIIGHTMAEVLGQAAVDQLRPYIDAALSGERVSYASQVQYASGMRHIEADYVPHVLPDGTTAGYYAFIRDVTQRRIAEQRQALLIAAGHIMGASLDYEATLSDLGELLVPKFADWYSLDLVDDDGRLQRLAIAHRDPEKVALARELRRRYPPAAEEQHGILAVLRTGQPALYADIPDALLAQTARDDQHLTTVRSLGLRSAMLVPLAARGRTLGVMTLVLSETDRRFGEADLAIAVEIATRAATAVDNARLYSATQDALTRREEALSLHREIEQQLTVLVEASDALSASLDLESVLDAILSLAGRLIPADGYALWRRGPATDQWHIAHAVGLSEEFRHTTAAANGNMNISQLPLVAEDVQHHQQLADRAEAYRREGIESLHVVPLMVRGETTATLVFYYRATHKFSEVQVRIAAALGSLAGSALGTAELYNELRESDRRKDEFLATLAHELRNPLAPISNAAQILNSESTQADTAWARDVIRRQVQQMGHLLDDLLDVSRISRGKLELRKQTIPLTDIIDNAVETSRPVIDAARHQLSISLPAECVLLAADSLRLSQVFANLLNNAAKYTEPGGRITLTAEVDGAQLRVAVSDTGIGISPEMLSRVFELFSQAAPALERSQGGLGIGLSLVKGLVEMHGGTIEAASQGPGHGSTFTVRLPIAHRAESPAPAPTTNNQPCQVRCKVVVADDNPDSVTTLGRLLQLMGHDVHTAVDGHDAVEKVTQFRPDVALLDIGMPRLNGYQVAQQIRQQPWGADVLLIALTGWGQEQDRQRSQQAGFDRHLVKPISYDDLLGLFAAVAASTNGDGHPQPQRAGD